MSTLAGVVEHVTHAASQHAVPVLVTTTKKTVTVEVEDTARRYALTQIVTEGRVLRHLWRDKAHREFEHIAGHSRLDPTFTVILTGPYRA